MGPVTDVPPLDRGSPETNRGPAVANPRIRVCSTVVSAAAPCHARSPDRLLASEPSGRRTLVPPTVETGHERGSRLMLGSLRRGGKASERGGKGGHHLSDVIH